MSTLLMSCSPMHFRLALSLCIAAFSKGDMHGHATDVHEVRRIEALDSGTRCWRREFSVQSSADACNHAGSSPSGFAGSAVRVWITSCNPSQSGDAVEQLPLWGPLDIWILLGPLEGRIYYSMDHTRAVVVNAGGVPGAVYVPFRSSFTEQDGSWDSRPRCIAMDRFPVDIAEDDDQLVLKWTLPPLEGPQKFGSCAYCPEPNQTRMDHWYLKRNRAFPPEDFKRPQTPTPCQWSHDHDEVPLPGSCWGVPTPGSESPAVILWPGLLGIASILWCCGAAFGGTAVYCCMRARVRDEQRRPLIVATTPQISTSATTNRQHPDVFFQEMSTNSQSFHS